MPTRNVVLTDHEASLAERLVSTGRFRSFESPAALGRHLTAIAEEMIGKKPAARAKRAQARAAGRFA